jgi:hypothetical protein
MATPASSTAVQVNDAPLMRAALYAAVRHVLEEVCAADTFCKDDSLGGAGVAMHPVDDAFIHSGTSYACIYLCVCGCVWMDKHTCGKVMQSYCF